MAVHSRDWRGIDFAAIGPKKEAGYHMQDISIFL